MERRVKERLVGAAVLVAAAVILVPEMLSGPQRDGEPVARSQSDEPFKTFTIDLNRSPGAPLSTPIEERAPPPETAPQTPAPQPSASDAPASDNSPKSVQASPESAGRTMSEPAPAKREPPAPRERAAPASSASTPPAPVAATPGVPTSKGWAVQLGSFANKATAERMAKEFSASGQRAFVMPVKSGSSTLYRVRVGPFAERAAANDALAGIRKRVANAAVVAHP